MMFLGLRAALPPMAGATTSGPTTYTATLKPVPLNGQTKAPGTLKLVLTGTKATITEHVSGLAATFTGKPFPHVQHIHGFAQGVCPTSATENTTGAISAGEAGPTYGTIQSTLSVAPGGRRLRHGALPPRETLGDEQSRSRADEGVKETRPRQLFEASVETEEPPG